MSTPTEALDVLRSAFDAFRSDPEGALAQLEPIYDDQVHFQDPIQTLDGRDAFMEMNRRLLRRARELSFDLLDSAAAGDQIFLTWRMRLLPKMGPALNVDGVTHIRLGGGKVIEQRDYWDLLGSVVDSFPVVAPIYKMIVARLG